MLVIQWLTNPEASYLLTALVHCNHHLVVLLYLKLPFAVTTVLIQTTTHQLGAILQGFPGSWQFFLDSCRVSQYGSKHSSRPSVCLNYKLQFEFTKYIINTELYLTLTKYVDKLLVAKSLINIKYFGWKY